MMGILQMEMAVKDEAAIVSTKTIKNVSLILFLIL